MRAGYGRRDEPAVPGYCGLPMSFSDYQPAPGLYGPPPPSSGKATAALVLGIAAFVVCPLVCAVLAIVFAHQAYSEIDASGGRVGGRGLAQAGLILGWV